MSQTSCERCGFPVPMRWLYAGGDLARPNHIHQCPDRPDALPTPAEVPIACSDLACVQTCSSHPARVASTIEGGASIKSP